MSNATRHQKSAPRKVTKWDASGRWHATGRTVAKTKHSSQQGQWRSRRSTELPVAIGGALSGMALGSLLGPVGAAAGFVAGGIAGEVYDRRHTAGRRGSGRRNSE